MDRRRGWLGLSTSFRIPTRASPARCRRYSRWRVNIQAELTGEGKITGEAKLTVGVTSQFIQLVERAESAIKLMGQYVANGVGSTGKSSPDAAARPRLMWARRVIHPCRPGVDNVLEAKASLKALEERLDRVAIRQCVAETIVATTIGLGGDLRRQIIAELRKNARVDVRDFLDPVAAERRHRDGRALRSAARRD